MEPLLSAKQLILGPADIYGMRGIGAILGYLLGGLGGLMGCATTSSYRREEEDPCPSALDCSCAEGTGWVPGLPSGGDRYIEIGPRRVDQTKELYSVKRSYREEYDCSETIYIPGEIIRDKRGHEVGRTPGYSRRVPRVCSKHEYSIKTYAPKVDFKFKLASDVPKSPSQFSKQTKFLTEIILKALMGNYSCSRGPHENVTIYVVGHADRLGDDQYNKILSEKRARRVAEGVMGWLYQHTTGLIQPVTIKYLGIGEAEARGNLEVDERGNERQRRVDVQITSFGPPINGDWRALTVVYPTQKPTPATPPPVAQEPKGKKKNPFWD